MKERTNRLRERHACDRCKARKTQCDLGLPSCGACERSSWPRKVRLRKKPTKKLTIPKKAKTAMICIYSRDSPVGARDQRQAQASPQPHIPSQRGSSCERRMRKRLSLQCVTEDFIGISQRTGQIDRQMKRIKGLLSGLSQPMVCDSSHASPTPSAKSHYLRTVKGGFSNKNTFHDMSQQQSVTGQLSFWETYLDAHIESDMREGRYLKAWASIASAMHGLEIIDIQHDILNSSTEELARSMESMCLKLIDWEWALSPFVGGDSLLSSWGYGRFLSTLIWQRKLNDPGFADQAALSTEMSRVVSVDTSHEEGLYEFLRRVNDLKCASPISDMERLAQLGMKGDSVQQRELGFVAELMCMMLNCRTAMICRYYMRLDRNVIPKSLCELLSQEELSFWRLRAKVADHAHRVLDRFEVLYRLNPAGTAESWIEIYGVLVAAAVVAVDQLRKKRDGYSPTKEKLGRIKICFEAMKSWNSLNSSFDQAIAILEECLVKRHTSPLSAETSGIMNSPSKYRRHSSPSDKTRAVPRVLPSSKADTKGAALSDPPDDYDDTSGRDSCENASKHKLTKAPLPAQEMIASEGSSDLNWSNDSSFTSAYEYPPAEQQIYPHSFVNTESNLGSSFLSSVSTVIDQTPISGHDPVSNFGISELHGTSFPHIYAYPEFPGQSPWALTSPNPPGPGNYYSFMERYYMAMEQMAMDTSAGQMHPQQYFGDMPGLIHRAQMPVPVPSSLLQLDTSSREGLEQPEASYASDSTTSFQSAMRSNMDQPAILSMEELYDPVQAERQGYGGHHGMISSYGNNGGFREE